MTELTPLERTKIHNKLETFQIIENITGVNKLALIALWGAFDQYKLRPSGKTKGFYNLPLNMDGEEMAIRLFSFNRLTIDEVSRLFKKGPENLICATLLIASDLKKSSKRVLFAEQDDKIVLDALRAFKPESVGIFKQLRELGL